MRIRFTYFNKITGHVESVYLTLTDFDKTNEAMDRAENAIFMHLYKEKPYNNEIKLINYCILE